MVLDNQCCMNQQACPVAVDGSQVYLVQFTIVLHTDGKDENSEEANLPCYTCAMKDVGPRQCPDGTYADKYLSVNPKGIVNASTQCIPCAPGTWMACVEKATCPWPIPLASNPTLATSTDYYVFDTPPVGACYPCAKAALRVFYGDDPLRKSVIYAQASFTTGAPLKWYCPGNQDGHDGVPRMCDPSFVGSFPPYSRCACADGTYENNGACVSCPPGSYCAQGVFSECPDDQYQSLPGQTACVRCDYSTQYCAPGSFLRRCVGQYKSVMPQCVPCNACMRPYASNVAGKVECLYP